MKQKRYWSIGIALVILSLGVSAASLWDGLDRNSGACLPARQAEFRRSLAVEALSGPAALVLGQKISLNQATARDLMALPGVGPGRAEKIIQWRNSYGPFRSLEELRKISGIGPRIFFQLQPYLSIY